jgi:hypothetical protein
MVAIGVSLWRNLVVVALGIIKLAIVAAATVVVVVAAVVHSSWSSASSGSSSSDSTPRRSSKNKNSHDDCSSNNNYCGTRRGSKSAMRFQSGRPLCAPTYHIIVSIEAE